MQPDQVLPGPLGTFSLTWPVYNIKISSNRAASMPCVGIN